MIGVLGGAFNPPHIGHLAMAREAVSSLGLAELLLVPTGEAPHKQIEDDPGARMRLEMVRLAAEGSESVRVDPIEVEAAERGEGPSYTYLTLEAIGDRAPDAELALIMGADTAAGLGDWREPERIVELAQIVVAGRPGAAHSDVEAALGRLGVAGNVTELEMSPIDASSTEVRARVRRGERIDQLVPDGVARLIDAEGLYR